jgi:hypothetical protein
MCGKLIVEGYARTLCHVGNRLVGRMVAPAKGRIGFLSIGSKCKHRWYADHIHTNPVKGEIYPSKGCKPHLSNRR